MTLQSLSPTPTAQTRSSLLLLTDFVLELRFEDIPDEVVRRAQDLCLDVLGVAVVGSTTKAGRVAQSVATQAFVASDPEYSARLLFSSLKASVAGATFYGATQIDNFDAHDGYAPCKGHIGVAVVPALFALADAMRKVTAAEFLVGLVQGYEIASRAGVSLHATAPDYHTSGAWNALAVAAVGARLRGLNANQLRHALGIAEFHGPRSQMMREIDNPTMLHDGSGWGALAGMVSVLTAERGFTGAPAVTVEADQVSEFWSDLGAHWLTPEQYLKLYPVCRWAHAPVDGVLTLRERYGLTSDQVEKIEIATFHEAARLASGMPQDTARAQYSLAFPVAAALVRGRLGIDEVLGSGLNDPEIARLVERTTVREEETYNSRFPEGRWGDVTLVTKDGRKLYSGALNARGGPHAPLSRDDVARKFHDFADGTIGVERAQEIEKQIFSLHEPGAELSPLVDLVLQE